jgi:hypothetical protein
MPYLRQYCCRSKPRLYCRMYPVLGLAHSSAVSQVSNKWEAQPCKAIACLVWVLLLAESRGVCGACVVSRVCAFRTLCQDMYVAMRCWNRASARCLWLHCQRQCHKSAKVSCAGTVRTACHSSHNIQRQLQLQQLHQRNNTWHIWHGHDCRAQCKPTRWSKHSHNTPPSCLQAPAAVAAAVTA